MGFNSGFKGLKKRNQGTFLRRDNFS